MWITNFNHMLPPMHWVKMHQWKGANCTNAFMQNDWVHIGKLHKPLPEINYKE